MFKLFIELVKNLSMKKKSINDKKKILLLLFKLLNNNLSIRTIQNSDRSYHSIVLFGVSPAGGCQLLLVPGRQKRCRRRQPQGHGVSD